MDKLQAINTMLLYINEEPLSALGTNIISETLADNILNEVISIVNYSLGISITDATLNDFSGINIYIVHRAGRMLYTRVIGTVPKEEYEVIFIEEKNSMGMVKKYIIDSIFSDVSYSNYKIDITGLLSATNTIEEASVLAESIFDRLGSINAPSYMSASDTIEYKLLIYRLDRDSQLSQSEKDKLLKKYALSSLPDKDIAYFKTYILGLLANATEKEEVDYIIDSIEDDIDSIVSPTIFSDENKNRYKLAILTSDSNTIQLLNNQYAKDYLATKVDIDYFKSYILSNLKGTTVEEITSEVDAYEATIKSFDISAKYPEIDNRIINEFILYSIMNDEKKYVTITSMAKQVISNYSDINDYEKSLMNDILLDNTFLKDINDIDNFKDIVANAFNKSKEKILSYGWNFNTTIVSFYPNSESNIVIPSSVLSIKSTNGSDYSIVDWRLFNKESVSFNFNSSVELEVVQNINYDDIASNISEYIYFDALVRLCITVGSKQNYVNKLNEAKVLALRDDANISNTNLLDKEYATANLSRSN